MPNATAKPAQHCIHVNGEETKTAAATLAELLDERGLTGVKVATALNGAFVAARARATQRLSDGDHIEVVSARQGG